MAGGERREVVSAADADGDAGDDRRRAYGGPRTRGRTSRDVAAGRKGGARGRRLYGGLSSGGGAPNSNDAAVSAIRDDEPLRAAI